MGLEPSAKCTSTVDEPKFRWLTVPHSRSRDRNVHSPSFILVLTVSADLVVDDRSRLLAESDSVKVTRLWRYAGQR